MKKLVLSLPIAIAMSLSGCGGDDTTLADINTEVVSNDQTVKPIAKVVFDPTGGKLSVPNDLLFSGTTDGTLEMPDEVAARAANGVADYSDPGQALGVLDGWSTQNPFVLAIDYPAGYSLGADSVSAPGAVRIFEVKMGGEVGCEDVQRGLACAPVAELTWGVDFVTSPSGNAVAVAPLKPLKAATTYIVALTTMLKDDAGRSVGPSATYELVKQSITTHPLATASQKALQAAVNTYEGVLAAGFGLGSDDIIYTAAMTTQSIGQVLPTIKTMMAANLSLNPAATPVVAVADTGLNAAQALQLPAEHPSYGAFSAAKLYAGQVNVPYYLATPSLENPLAPVNTPWKAACDTAVMVSAYAAQAGDSYPYDPAATVPVSLNDAMCMQLSGGLLRDFTNAETGFVLDKERHLTKYNKIPMQRSTQTLDVQMTVPDVNVVNAVRGALGWPEIAMPEGGWPVVIQHHGITLSKETMLATTGTLALFGYASVAIDLPLHGSRGFDIDPNNPGDEINTTTVSATHFMNLAHLPTARDNLRQSVSDLLALRLGLNFIQGAPINPTDVSVISQSLGAIGSTKFLAVTNTKTLDATLGAPGLDNLFAVKTGLLASPGGGIGNFLVESGSFGSIVQGSVLAAAGTPLSQEFNEFMAAGVPECLSYLPDQSAYVACSSQIFLLQLATTGQDAKIAEFKSTIAQFLFVAQSVIDGGDPSNFAAMLSANGTPILLTEIVGDGMENLSDQVIPNQTENTPIGGTEPLIRALGLQPITGSKTGELDENGVPGTFSGVIRYTKGHHASVFYPGVRAEATDAAANARVTQEMQTQAVSFFASGGRAIQITDGEFILGHD
jgi:Pla-1/cef family extracellular lipase